MEQFPSSKHNKIEQPVESEKFASYTDFIIFLDSFGNKDELKNKALDDIKNAMLSFDSYRNHLLDIACEGSITRSNQRIEKASMSNLKDEHKKVMVDFEKEMIKSARENAEKLKTVNVGRLLDYIDKSMMFNQKTPRELGIFVQVKEYLKNTK